MKRIIGYRALGVAVGFVTLLALPASSLAATATGVPNPAGATDVTGSISVQQLTTPKTISGTQYNWEATWSDATMPTGVPTGNLGAAVDLYGWEDGTTPSLFSDNILVTPTPATAQSGRATYTAYFNMPSSYPKTGEMLEFTVQWYRPAMPESPMFNTANVPTGQTPEVPWAAGLPLLGLAAGGWLWKRQAMAR